MDTDTTHHLREILESFDTAMLITRAAGEQQHARPMAVAAVEGLATLWFVTSASSPKALEVQRDARVSATFQSSARFVALSGHAELVRNPAKVDELWKASWNVWFPEGKNDPSIVLIRVDVADVEFWDNAGSKGIRYVFEAAKALFNKDAPREVEGQHARLKRPDLQPASGPSRSH